MIVIDDHAGEVAALRRQLRAARATLFATATENEVRLTEENDQLRADLAETQRQLDAARAAEASRRDFSHIALEYRQHYRGASPDEIRSSQ